ncbi:SLC13 family permease [Arcanobacterium pinnipediorum]|uniref:Sodium-dependent dicarboxylate transporter SdcS n=1 Tax=Arcanobacterium pinnipediorum TaxID=1503041 RepID=A0ABY5AI10_9ACTO|nr:DASS family sodium-coupled anion symporter [Arcanobacterium pinnipediorum]USR79834.1 DASS family sodium-coupled anion symporter [Arcanobacterium pinnipediorum]
MSIIVTNSSTEHPPIDDYNPPEPKVWIIRAIGLLGGIVAALAIYFIMPDSAIDIAQRAAENDPPENFNPAGLKITAATTILMGIWWMTEAIPLAATALVPLVVFPIFQVTSFGTASAPYASSTIFLFMGGFILALAMQRWNLHRRVALVTILLLGTTPKRIIGGIMLATGIMSMWVSNTATAVMMLPIGISILHLVGHIAGTDDSDENAIAHEVQDIPDVARDATKGGVAAALVSKGKDAVDVIKEKAGLHHSNFAVGLMLGIAYSASIGSLGTLIGTPPNTLLQGYLKETHDIEIGFGQWMLVGVPLAIVFMIIGWFVLTHVIFKPEIDHIPGGKELIRKELRKMGRMSRGEKLVGIIFLLAALSWIIVPIITQKYFPDIKISDSAIAMTVAVLLFIIPADPVKGIRLMNWETAKNLPWDVLLLFGGGLALSAQFTSSGLSLWIGAQAAGLSNFNILVMIAVVTTLIIFLTELTSNTATAAAFLPIMGGVALGTGTDVLLLTIPVALAATSAFMLPVATPPNAIAYGSGYIRMADMIRAGVWLNIIGIVLITATIFGLVVPVFGISL